MEHTIVTPLSCVGKDGEHRELISVVSSTVQVFDLMKVPPDRRRHWRYRVYKSEEDRRAERSHYSAEFIELDDGRAISRDMQAPLHLRDLGIPDAVILHMARERIVVSSSSRDRELLRGESRTEDAAKVWRRLVSRGLANPIGVDRYETAADTNKLP